MASSPEPGSPPASSHKHKHNGEKKRKRSSKHQADDAKDLDETKADSKTKEDLLEVDISAATPLSKKQKRLQKKGKLELDDNGEEIKKDKPAKPKGTEDDDLYDDANKDEEKSTEKVRSQHGIWIGNLPWSATKQTLRLFLLRHMGIMPPPFQVGNENDDFGDHIITRVHLPPPTKAAADAIPGRFTPTNKGFAYVDFSTAQYMSDALLLTETEFSGRRVLIKPAGSFEGRPAPAEVVATAATATTTPSGFTGAAAKPIPGAKPPNKRVFIGNLSFDATREDLETMYGVCGEIALTHVATFEDSGKCKGYAWITFADIPSAEKAVRGYTEVSPADEEAELDRITGEADEEADEKKPKKSKKIRMRKIWANRLHGRQLRCEFAEDADTRYAKRYGKDAKKAASKEKKIVENVPGLPSNITGAIVAATGKRTMFDN